MLLRLVALIALVAAGCEASPEVSVAPVAVADAVVTVRSEVPDLPNAFEKKTEGPGAAADPAPAPRYRMLCFGATWCAPCVAAKPRIKKLAEAMGFTCSEFNDADVQMIDVDESPVTTKKYGVGPLPAYVLIDADGNNLKHYLYDGWSGMLGDLKRIRSSR